MWRVLLEVAAADWDYPYAQPSQLTKIAPHCGEVELTLRRSIGKNCHQIPVALRAMRSPGAAAEQSDQVMQVEVRVWISCLNQSESCSK